MKRLLLIASLFAISSASAASILKIQNNLDQAVNVTAVEKVGSPSKGFIRAKTEGKIIGIMCLAQVIIKDSENNKIIAKFPESGEITYCYNQDFNFVLEKSAGKDIQLIKK